MANQISLDPKFTTHEPVDLESWPSIRLENIKMLPNRWITYLPRIV